MMHDYLTGIYIYVAPDKIMVVEISPASPEAPAITAFN